MLATRILLATVMMTGAWWVAAAGAAERASLEGLQPAHPRLFMRANELAGFREAVKSDAQLKAWHDRLRADAERILTQKPVEHVLIGPRLLDKSRTALNRISTLAGLYLLDGDRRFADRAKQEMFTVIAFKDWNPSHFLDTAEMSNAVGIGYDWLYDYLTAEERRAVREGLVRLGLQVGLDSFKSERPAFWTRATHNWSQVCNGGLTVGALAIADEEKELAAELIERCRVAIRPSMNAFAPDGGFAEGPGYWGYATIYNIYYLAAVESALGTDFGLKAMPGFAETGFYRIHSVSPTGMTFNYADAGDRAGTAPQMFYLGRVFEQKAFVDHELGLAGGRGSIFHMVWYYQWMRDARMKAKSIAIPLDAAFRGVNVAFFRSAWNDPNAMFVGIKGGDNRANHSHLDLGSFVLDAQGRRWAVDLGGDDYNLPGYFGNKRWTYYRLRTESHNTLTLDGENQSTDGKAAIVAFGTAAKRGFAVIDLTHGYRQKASRVQRGLAMLDRSAVLVQDELETKAPVEVVWNFLTPSKVSIEGKKAVLKQGDSTLMATILSPADARFEVISANPPPPQKQQPNVSNLTVRLPEKVSSARIAVLLAPADAPAVVAEVKPLEAWKE